MPVNAQPNPFASHWLIRDIVIGSHIGVAGPESLLFIGDSIVEGFYWNSVGSHAVVNAGYSGIWTEALEPKVERLLTVAKPRLAALLVGTNDAKQGRGEEYLATVATLYEKTVRLFSASGVRLIAITPPPVEQGKRLTGYYSGEAMHALAREVVQIATHHGHGVIDLHGALSTPDRNAKAGATIDGIHLSPPAYRLMRDMLERKIAEMDTEGKQA
ncbi:SGNH/GDSL hydrolase family protein [Microvirga flavescens]|uniref:SGNH/GDSL hydrolase family protein n=1 Tax=Microvirga flavescens TaxID=2249811 RepID=UPI000DD855B0|nr:GDSL-type esterase/lipase family protein [Microvirga flavescens]